MLSEEDRSKDTDPHFVRACAVERHFNVSQEPLDTENYRKNAAPQNEPRTRTHILCERAQSKRMSIFHKNHLYTEIYRKMPRPKTAAQTLCEPAQSKRMSTFHKNHLYTEIYRKMPRPKTAAQTLCEPAQSKRMSTFHKSHFMQKIARKRRETRVSTLIKHRPLHLP